MKYCLLRHVRRDTSSDNRNLDRGPKKEEKGSALCCRSIVQGICSCVHLLSNFLQYRTSRTVDLSKFLASAAPILHKSASSPRLVHIHCLPKTIRSPFSGRAIHLRGLAGVFIAHRIRGLRVLPTYDLLPCVA